MKKGFVAIPLEEYVTLHLQANPGVDRADLIQRLHNAMDAYAKDVRCHCGEPLWIIGSAEVGFSCFTCITGAAMPDNDYEIDVPEPQQAGHAPPRAGK